MRMTETHKYLEELVYELELLKDDKRLDEQTLNIVLWIANDYLIRERAHNTATSIRNRPKLIK